MCVLGDQARQLIVDAEAFTAELDEQRSRRDAAAADLAERARLAGQLREEHERMLPSLTAWCEADANLADSLHAAGLAAGSSSLDSVRAELSEVSQRIVTDR